jgi:RNA polymerase sigma-70 factor (ECF subfamily)
MTVAADTSAFAPPMSRVERARAAAARVGGTALTPLGCADTTDAASDACLMERVAEGDRGAMRLLFTRHHLTVYRFVLRLVGNSATAEDIVSDVFIELWRHAASFEGRAKLSTWILAIARNRAVSATRGRINQPLEDAMLEAIPDQAPTADETLAAGERSAILRQCLEKLSPAHREIIDLVYYHERSIEEVATIVAAPAGTVKTRMFYARKLLAEHLRAAGIETAQG